MGARVEWILLGRTRQRRVRIFWTLCEAYRCAIVVPVKYRTTFYKKNAINRSDFQIDLFFKVFLLDLFLTKALEFARIVGGIRLV